MSDVNPYAPPTVAQSYATERAERLMARFYVESEDIVRRSVRSNMPGEAAESVGIAAFLLLLVGCIVLAVTFFYGPLVFVGYFGGALGGFVARELALRRMARRFFRKMQSRLGIAPGARCEVQLTRTKLLLNMEGKRWVYPLRETFIRKAPGFMRNTPPVVMNIVARGEVVLPITALADLGGASVDEFVKECQRRRVACESRRRRFRWRRLFRPRRSRRSSENRSSENRSSANCSSANCSSAIRQKENLN